MVETASQKSKIKSQNWLHLSSRAKIIRCVDEFDTDPPEAGASGKSVNRAPHEGCSFVRSTIILLPDASASGEYRITFARLLRDCRQSIG